MKLSSLVLSVLVCASAFAYAGTSDDMDFPVRESETATIGIDLTLPEGIKGPSVTIPLLPDHVLQERDEKETAAKAEKAAKVAAAKKAMTFAQRAASEANPALMEKARLVETKDNRVYKADLIKALAKLPQNLTCKTKGSTADASSSNLDRVQDRIRNAQKIYVNTSSDTIILENRKKSSSSYSSSVDVQYTYIFLDPSEKHIVGLILTNTKGGTKVKSGKLTEADKIAPVKCSYGYASKK